MSPFSQYALVSALSVILLAGAVLFVMLFADWYSYTFRDGFSELLNLILASLTCGLALFGPALIMTQSKGVRAFVYVVCGEVVWILLASLVIGSLLPQEQSMPSGYYDGPVMQLGGIKNN